MSAIAGIRDLTMAFVVTAALTWSVGAQSGDAAPRTCGTDEIVAEPYPVRVEYVIRAGDSRGFAPCAAGAHDERHREMREAAVIQAAAQSSDPALRTAAAQAYGKLGPASVRESLLALLKDSTISVRLAAAQAIPHALDGVLGERTIDAASARPDPALIEAARAALVEALSRESSDDVGIAMLESLGVIKYPDDRARDAVETFLGSAIDGPPGRVLGVVKGLEALIRANPKRLVGEAARQRLRRLVMNGSKGGDSDTASRIRRLAMIALQTARDDDIPTLLQAAVDADWQVRRLAALRMDFARPELQSAATVLMRDPAFQVRYDILGARARALAVAKPKDCAAFLQFVDDPHPLVAMRAIDLLPADCAAPGAVVTRLRALAAELQKPGRSWHVPARAIAALARIEPTAARAYLERAAAHDVWQVRATAATAAGLLSDEALVTRLAEDRHANVRTAALESMRRFGPGPLTSAALNALESSDHQLVRTAATLLPEPAPVDRDRVATALLASLSRLTAIGEDTSRDPRVAILAKLATVLPAERAQELRPYLTDFDPRVRAAAANAVQRLTNSAPPPVTPQFRYPLQPPASDLASLPTRASITMADGGVLEFALLVTDAPVTIARFARVAREGGYNGLTFHRMAPNFVIQGGSAGANEYVGAARYMRDEVGAPNVRGTIGISTRGRDSGDAQIFINLVDSPRLDHEYTVFARLISGSDVLDRILEGAEIRTVTVR